MDSEGSSNPSRGKGGLLIWSLVLLLLVSYPLSIGPVRYIYPYSVPKWLQPVYAPLVYLNEKVPAVTAFYDWYIPIWIKASPRPQKP